MNIIVEPFGLGWAVRADAVENVQAFRSGAEAEAAARRLALTMATAGEPVSAEIVLRSGDRVGLMRFGG